MNVILELNKWSSTHHPRWLVALRIALGISLFIKGFQFVQNTAFLQQVISETGVPYNSGGWLQASIPWIHLFGGLLICLGLLTRLAALIQIPVVLGAIFFVNLRHGLALGGSELLFSILILVLLFVFVIEGSGPISMDGVIRDSRKE